jgi:unsaturated rhamnogalacturonyl hydrolase
MNKFFVFTLIGFLKITSATYAQTVTLDYYFNHETHKTKMGTERFHYLWDDKQSSGFSIWGDIFKKNGLTLDTLDKAPTLANLRKSDIYIIVDPDTKKETANPNYIEPKDVEQISAWVKAGGVLVLMANDSANVELPHFNTLVAKFGLHFNNDLPNHVLDDNHFKDGDAIYVNNDIFKSNPKIFLKDACSISLNNPAAKAVFKSADGSVVIAATVKYGKGIVFAVGDPWLYNEYVNGRLPSSYQNDIAANELTIWLKKQASKK